jgi:hypothetical protein
MSHMVYVCAFGHQLAYDTAVWAMKLKLWQRHKQSLRTGHSTKCVFHVYFYQQANAVPLRKPGRLYAFSPSDVYARKEEESEKVRRTARKRPEVQRKGVFRIHTFFSFHAPIGANSRSQAISGAM